MHRPRGGRDKPEFSMYQPTRCIQWLYTTRPFRSALYLHPTVEAVVEHNVSRLHANGQPIATIKAVHTGPNASPDEAAGLEAIVCLAHEARVMLTANLWTGLDLSMVPWEPLRPFVTRMEKLHRIYQHQ